MAATSLLLEGRLLLLFLPKGYHFVVLNEVLVLHQLVIAQLISVGLARRSIEGIKRFIKYYNC